MELNVHIVYSAEICDLTYRYPCLSFLEHFFIPDTEMNQWVMNNDYWGHKDKIVHELHVMVIGKTGYGKSSTLNRIIGYDKFETDDISVCTKDLYDAVFRLNKRQGTFLSFCDMPGIGESNYADDQYYMWYRDMLEKSHCVLYVIRADQRDYAMDKMIFRHIFTDNAKKEKVVLALNFADKVEPVNRKSVELSSEQRANLKAKVDDVSKIFQISKRNIVYYSAATNLNVDILVRCIAEKLKRAGEITVDL